LQSNFRRAFSPGSGIGEAHFLGTVAYF